ncbi:MAG: extracellular solute-binding protein [Spirochaetales bacterium]|nr:extracellular solute-binding protein [Spirochaetales bacterium]
MKKILVMAAVCMLVSFNVFATGSQESVESGSAPEEKKLVVYSPNSEGLLNAVEKPFEEKYGIEVEFISAGTGECLKRIEAEKHDPQGDVMYGGSYATILAQRDLWADYVSKNDAYLVEAFRNESGYVTKNTLDGSVIVINKTKMAEKLPGVTITGYEDIIKYGPQLEGQIVSGDPAKSSSSFAHLTNMLIDFGGYESDAAWDKVADIFKNLKVLGSSSGVWKGVRDGEYTIGLSYEDPCLTLINDGADVEVIYMEEGVVFLPAGCAIIKDAKHPEAAKLFMDFITSKEVQEVYGMTLTNRPVYEGVKTADYMKPLDQINVKVEDTAYVSANKQNIVDRYIEMYTSLED